MPGAVLQKQLPANCIWSTAPGIVEVYVNMLFNSVSQDSTRDNKTEIINLEDSILRREEDVEIIDSSDNDDGSDSDFDDLIDDQILEEFYDELDENNVADDVESGYGVGLSIESSLQSKNRVKLVPEGSEKF